MPGEATVVPKNQADKQMNGRFEFIYDGWTVDNTSKEQFVSSGAEKKDVLPATWKEILDLELLKQYGLTIQRMKAFYSLFFLQLLLPICNPEQSGVKDDKDVHFLFVKQLTNMFVLGSEPD